ncbi:MAG: NAD-binding protein [Casimicrobiaceae bacterium]|nr:NAD-binding protein [Casimicrobiaceae bacterium]MDW8312073.1 NAD-binding protein [Burkholderiales bacterium]
MLPTQHTPGEAGDIAYLVLRRLRWPLIALILAYAIAVIGMTFMPGIDAEGRPWNMSLFHAFYVMSYTATTIGFGELPYTFSNAQRAWMTFSIYLTVIAWTYTLGAIFTLVADVNFRAAVARSIFAWRVRSLGDPFYVLCGYGQSGRQLARALDRLGFRVIIIELRRERSASAAIDRLAAPAIVLTDDARVPETLRLAGITRSLCRGLIVLTGDDTANQGIAIGARTLAPDLTVIARVRTETAKVNLEAFGGVHVIHPFETFATNIALDLDHPEVLRLEEWLTAAPDTPCPERVGLPPGSWVIVGFGRFGRAIANVLEARGIAWHAIDNHELEATLRERSHLVIGQNTDRSLKDSGIGEASVLVAGTDNDAINLAAVTLARRLNPNIWVIIRQNHAADRVLIRAARAQMRFVQAEIVVHECLQLLHEPLLGAFLRRVRAEGGSFAERVRTAIQARLGDGAPLAWSLKLDLLSPGVFYALLQSGRPFLLAHLLEHRDEQPPEVPAMALMVQRGAESLLLPSADTELKAGDRVLMVGRAAARTWQQRLMLDASAMQWQLTGQEPPRTWLFRWLADRQARRQALLSQP